MAARKTNKTPAQEATAQGTPVQEGIPAVQEQPTPEGTAQAQEPEQTPVFPYQITLASPTHVRSGPGIGYKVTGTAPRGKHTITEEKDGWGKLKRRSGWINLRYAQPV